MNCRAILSRPAGTTETDLAWSFVPSLRWWNGTSPHGTSGTNPLAPGKRFYLDRPEVDVPEA